MCKVGIFLVPFLTSAVCEAVEVVIDTPTVVKGNGLKVRDETLGRAVIFHGVVDGISGSLTTAVIYRRSTIVKVKVKINAIGFGDARFLVAIMLKAALCYANVLIIVAVFPGIVIVIVIAKHVNNETPSEFVAIIIALPERVTRRRLFPRRAKLVIAPRVWL
jgi:hypothetical protein